jgi:hypothetical protein
MNGLIQGLGSGTERIDRTEFELSQKGLTAVCLGEEVVTLP